MNRIRRIVGITALGLSATCLSAGVAVAETGGSAEVVAISGNATNTAIGVGGGPFTAVVGGSSVATATPGATANSEVEPADTSSAAAINDFEGAPIKRY